MGFVSLEVLKGESIGLLYHDDVVLRITLMLWSRGNADGYGVGPVGFHERRDNEEHESDAASRFARCPAYRHGAQHGRRQRVRQQSRWERVQRVVGLRCAVRTRLNRPLAEATIWRPIIQETGVRDQGKGGGRARSTRIRCVLNAGRGTGKTHRTSIVRASKDARRARSFSRPGGSSGIAAPPLAVEVVVVVDDMKSRRKSTARIADCEALIGRWSVVKRFGGRANARV